MNSPYLTRGGKQRIAKKIIKLFVPHQFYIEPFCGAASVFFAKSKRPVYATSQYKEILNDINSNIVKFFITLRDDPKSLINDQLFVPYAEDIYNDPSPWKEELQTLIKARMSFGGKPGFGYACRLTKHGGQRSQALTWKKMPERLTNAAWRLKDAYIFNRDFRDIIKKFDSPDALFYCDPPYIGAEAPYSFSDQDHVDLAILMNNITGNALISYWENPLIYELYPSEKWKFYYLERKVHGKKCIDKKRPIKTEVLIKKITSDNNSYPNQDKRGD